MLIIKKFIPLDKKENIKKEFEKTMKKDANLSMFVFGPFFLVFYVILAYNSNWPEILSIIFAIIVLLITFFIFYYSSLFKRGELMQRVVKEISINGDKIDVKSFGWFFKKQKEYHFNKNAIISTDKHFNLFKFKGIKLRIENECYKTELLIINDFFDKLNNILPKEN